MLKKDTLFKNELFIKLINLLVKKGNFIKSQKIFYKFILIINANTILNIKKKNKFKCIKYCKKKKQFSQFWSNNNNIKTIFKPINYIELSEIINKEIIPVIGLIFIDKLVKKKKITKFIPVINKKKLIMLGLRIFISNSFKKPFNLKNLIEEYNNIKLNKGICIKTKKDMYKLLILKKKLFNL